MKFTLKDYQDEAVAEVLSNLRKALEAEVQRLLAEVTE